MKQTAIYIVIFALIFALLVGCGVPSSPTPPDVINEEPAEIEPPEDVTIDAPALEKEPEPTPVSGQLIAHFIDVGQGDSILVQVPSGVNLLIDGGPRSAGQKVVSYLKQAGISSIDLMIGSHPHEDHIGGLISVMHEFAVGEVIDPAVVHTTKTFEDYLTLIDQKDTKFTEGRAGMEWDLGGGAKLSLLHPVSPSSNHLNDSSVVAKLTFGQVSFLFTGDAEEASERQMLTQGRVQPTSTILKVGHHGSRTSTTQAFLDAVNPEVAVIMCGKDNSYGHPHEETLQKLSSQSVSIYRTDLHGNIVITTDGQTYDINIKQPYQFTAQEVPEPDPEPAMSDGIYVGSIKSDKYHYPNCRHAQSINSENEIWFDSIEAAKNEGYVPCGVCSPPR